MSVIRTNEANCKDCYKCLRSCPVKAIRVERTGPAQQLRARVEENRCILDGHCISVCPQGAKGVRIDYPEVSRLIQKDDDVWVSLAPSFAAAFPGYRPGQVVAALKKLGFAGVQETAVAAEWVAAEHARVAAASGRPVTISSSCPAVVNLIEMYYPETIPALAPVVSPMIAHARHLKSQNGERKVVFIGPCLAKHDEMSQPGLEGAVDYVLAFNELEEWWEEAGIDPAALGDEPFDGPRPDNAVLFPLDGGLLRTAALSTDMLDRQAVTISGVENCQAFLEGLNDRQDHPRMVEMMACPGGCINGPLMPRAAKADGFSRRQQILRYRAEHPGFSGEEAAEPLQPEALYRSYGDRTLVHDEPSEEVLRGILARSGKTGPADEINCGACGYGSCREKAIAVFQGMADPEMCIPYMRVRAESMSNLVVASTPNGILVVDGAEIIRDINASAERMFQVSRGVAIGSPISSVMDPQPFRTVLNGEEAIVRAERQFPALNLVARITVVRAEKENIALALVEDVTESRSREGELQKVRTETLERAQQVIDKQMAVAQKIAGLLGETTAETKVLLTRLMRVMKEEGNSREPALGNRPGPTE